MIDRFKFRAWDKDAEEMSRCFTLIEACEHDGIFLGAILKSERTVVMQCTGLKDKNGKLIYMSDYIRLKDGSVYKVVEHELKISLENISLGITIEMYEQYKGCEIVGNEFETTDIKKIQKNTKRSSN